MKTQWKSTVTLSLGDVEIEFAYRKSGEAPP
jgi:hypothetical protein